MPVLAIPETKESYLTRVCPSLYTILQFLVTVTAFAVLVACISCTLWVETFLLFGQTKYRYLSVGLWQVCYYRNSKTPGIATECITVKFNDFTLTVQIWQCISVSALAVCVALCLIRMLSKCCRCGMKNENAISYNTRKFRIVCQLVAILGISLSIALYMCEANIEGVRLSSGIDNIKYTSTQEVTKTTTPAAVNSSHATNASATTTEFPKPPHYSVFALGLWMQFVALVLTVIAFAMALVKHFKKRNGMYDEQSTNSGSRTRPGLTLEMKSRPRSESQRAFFSRQSSSNNMLTHCQEMPVSP